MPSRIITALTATLLAAGILGASAPTAEAAFNAAQRGKIAACQTAITGEGQALLVAQVAAVENCAKGLALANIKSGAARTAALRNAKKACKNVHVPALMDSSTVFVDNVKAACTPAAGLVLNDPADPLGFRLFINEGGLNIDTVEDLAGFICATKFAFGFLLAITEAPKGGLLAVDYLENTLGINDPFTLIDPRCAAFADDTGPRQ